MPDANKGECGAQIRHRTADRRSRKPPRQQLQAISQKSCSVLQSMGPKIQWVQSGGTSHDVIAFMNGAAIDATDFVFV